MRTPERGSDSLTAHDKRRCVPPRWLHEGMLAAVSLGVVGIGAFMLIQLTRSDLPLVGRVSGSAFVVTLPLAVLSLWYVTRTYRRAGEPDDWRLISRETDEGRAFWRARRRSLEYAAHGYGIAPEEGPCASHAWVMRSLLRP
jgi:hypothetical protein